MNHCFSPKYSSIIGCRDWDLIESLGFKRDFENDVMVLEGYGAFIQNLCSDVECLEDLNRKDLKFAEWNNSFYALQNEGWKLVLGPGMPESGMTAETKLQYFGLYCKNYLEIAEKEKQEANSIIV